MKFHAYLNFSGQCEEAFRLYERVFGGKIETLTTFADSPMSGRVPADWSKKILHARLVAGEQVLLGSDAPPDQYQKPQGFAVSLSIAEPEEAERIFKTLSERGTIQLPIQQTFWSARFGMLTDRFGIPWFVNCEQPADVN